MNPSRGPLNATGGFALALIAFTCVLAASIHNRAHAYEVELDAQTVFRAYETRTPAAGTLWSRRRIVQDLELRISETLSETQPNRPTPRVRSVAQLRLSQEVGDTCFTNQDRCFDASDSRFASTYQALATDGVLDAMLAYVEVVGLPAGFEARAGRQLWFDPVGFLRLDGISARLAPTPWFAANAAVGLQTRATSVAGSSAFEVPGTIRLDLSARQQLLAGFASPAVDTWIASSSIDVGDDSILRGQLSYREMFDDDGLVMRRVGVSLRSSPIDALHLSSLAVFDAVDRALVLGNFHAHWQLDRVALLASADVMRPRFELGSIWAYFPTAAVEQAEVGASVEASDVTRVGGGVRARRTAGRDLSDDDAGLHGFVATRVAKITFDLDAYGWLGDLGDLWGADLSASRALSSWLQLQLGASVQRVNDPARVDFDGVSIAEWAQIAWQLSPRTKVSFELTHAHNPIVSHRFAALASLDIGAWR